MSGWRIVPVEPTEAMLASIPNYARNSPAGVAVYRTMLAAATEPDWETLAGIVLNDDVYDQYATGGEIRRLAAALKAAFGSKP